MFRTTPVTTATQPTPPATETPLQVRLGIEDVDYEGHDLSSTGFAISSPAPLTPGTLTHVSFRLAPGLSISLQTRARTWQMDSEQQWFEFGDVDRDILAVLLLSNQSSLVH
jgi:hypothetical protein